MLDLMTLGVSMGLQKEVEKTRKETGATEVFADNSPVHSESSMTTAATAVGSALNAAETAVCSAASSMLPSWEMIEGVVEAVTPEAPTMDLTLPTQKPAKK